MVKRIDKEKKERVMEKIMKAGDSENYETSWDEKGVPYKIKKKSEIKKGKQSKSRGSRFELKVREDLEKKGRVVDKWNNNVDLKKDELIIAKKKFNPYAKIITLGTGFPDFISIKHINNGLYSVIGVEVKTNGILSREEKEKCVWYLNRGIFSDIWIAKKGEKRGEIKYDDFREKYGKKFNVKEHNKS